MARILFTHGPVEKGTLATIELFKQLELFGHLPFLFREKLNKKDLNPWLTKSEYFLKNNDYPDNDLYNELKIKWLPYINAHYNYGHAVGYWGEDKSDGINVNNKFNEIFFHSYGVVDAIEPDIVLIWGGGLRYGCGILGDIAKNKGIKIYHTENGLIPWGIMIDEKGHLWNSSTNPLTVKDISSQINSNDLENIKKIYEVFKSSPPLRDKEQSSISNDEKIWFKNNNLRKVLFIGSSQDIYPKFSNDLNNKALHLPYFENYQNMIQEILDTDEFCVVYKPHPGVQLPVKINHPYFLISHSDPNEWIDLCDLVIANGTHLELNVLLKEKPLILPGFGFFINKGCAYEPRSKDEFFDLLLGKNIQFNKEQKNNLIKYLAWLNSQYYFKMHNSNDPNDLINPRDVVNDFMCRVGIGPNFKTVISSKGYIYFRDQHLSGSNKMIMPLRTKEIIKLLLDKFFQKLRRLFKK